MSYTLPRIHVNVIARPHVARTAVYAGGRFSNESKDCTVRAASVATGEDYAKWHEYLRKLGRKDNDGFFFPEILLPMQDHLGFRFIVPNIFQSNMSLGKAITLFKYGNYIGHIKGHAFPIIDGVVHDHNRAIGLNTRMRRLWRVVKL